MYRLYSLVYNLIPFKKIEESNENFFDEDSENEIETEKESLQLPDIAKDIFLEPCIYQWSTEHKTKINNHLDNLVIELKKSYILELADHHTLMTIYKDKEDQYVLKVDE